MRSLAGFALVAVLCGDAWAFDHQARVDEVLVSKNGDTTIQFIEIEDPGETFPNDPYRLEIYDGTGILITNGTVNIGNVAAGTTRIFVSTAAADTAFGTTGIRFSGTLPANGQACFINVANVKIHCLAWGCFTTQIIGSVNTRAPSPPDNLSAQLQPSFTYQLATPTPDAANIAGTMDVNCPTDPPPDDFVPPDDLPPDGPTARPDAPTHDNNGGGGGCCSASGGSGSALLALLVSASFLRRRRRP